ncbi:SDR family oxidoreductase [Aeromicrobium sp. 636]|uniref:SDR family oxidoreductase n=1 Tax=Aeromicrobium senzhongii TaxID=2663859 RepID=A0A8I0ET45_9ACTN|nr:MULTISPECIES: SDR family oxidoreductase [Aeromicrobium]MBC9224907.1 SDR family oxidoreductase [Aeromicrobium senzhongii]MCQ3997019.1 SDR family oxidoreductase [Aeromicrobium sp. 636]
MAKLDIRTNTCLVTGATGGIGAATARALTREGARLVLTDLDQGALDAVAEELRAAGGEVLVATALDLTDAASVRSFAEAVHVRFGPMDVLLNIAGISIWGTIDRLTEEHWRRLIDINLMGPVHVLSSFLPAMIDAGRGGHVVNVSSAAGIFGLPWHAAYSASKFGLRGISEVLRFDLRRHRIGVSLVCPGAVATPLVQGLEVVGVDRSVPAMQKVEQEFLRHAITPDEAAAAIVKGLVRRRYWVYTSRDVAIGHYAQRWFPWGYVVAMRLLNRKLTRAEARAVRAAAR